ncbi:peptidoglycan DD-metalloendopeptidase family protein [Kribbella sp. NPDC006257]|uniref:M23 family metallopeptidase n=1 Tax=Kribbella sp. NPDC006257 TaxID=3156738 RepID=UPI0033BF5D50
MTLTPRTTLAAIALTFASSFVLPALPALPAPPVGVWPLSPRPAIVRGFEPPAKPWLTGHRGLDLAGSPGQPVLSATAGTITYAGPLAGRGVVVVTNGPFRTTYEPVIPTIHRGATVTPGTQLGTLSTAGTHCPPNPCLHWGLLNSATYLNPLSLLPTHPIRLLPQPDPNPQPPLTAQPTDTPNRPDSGAPNTAPSLAPDALTTDPTDNPAPGSSTGTLASPPTAARGNPAALGDPSTGVLAIPPSARGNPAALGEPAAGVLASPPNARSNPTVVGEASADGGSRPTGELSTPAGVHSSPTGARSPADRSTGPATAVVGIAAALTLGGALLIRRH